MNFITNLIIVVVFAFWALAGFIALSGNKPTDVKCPDGYVVVAGVNVMGWPGRWVCVPGSIAEVK